MTAPDARVAFLTAVLGDVGLGSGTELPSEDSHGGGYSHEQMMEPAQFAPLLARALPLYINGLKVCLCRARQLCRLDSTQCKQETIIGTWTSASLLQHQLAVLYVHLTSPPMVSELTPECVPPMQECLLADDVDTVGSASHTRLSSLMFLGRCLILTGVSSELSKGMTLASCPRPTSLMRGWRSPPAFRHGHPDVPAIMPCALHRLTYGVGVTISQPLTECQSANDGVQHAHAAL